MTTYGKSLMLWWGGAAAGFVAGPSIWFGKPGDKRRPKGLTARLLGAGLGAILVGAVGDKAIENGRL